MEPEVQQLPLPPPHLSATEHVNREWRAVIEDSKRGHPQSGRIAAIDFYLATRKDHLDSGKLRTDLDWTTDWNVANGMYHFHRDQAAWWQVHREKIEAFWLEHVQENASYLNSVALAGLKTIFLVHGALALASLAVLSGQVADPRWSVLIAARIALVAALVGLGMASIGQVLLFHFMSQEIVQVRSVLGARRRLRRLYALGRYIAKYYHPRYMWVNGLIYGSVLVFIAGAALAAIVLFSTDIQ